MPLSNFASKRTARFLKINGGMHFAREVSKIDGGMHFAREVESGMHYDLFVSY